jgi:hypothetical protein
LGYDYPVITYKRLISGGAVKGKEAKKISTRQYSSFLLRLWRTPSSPDQKTQSNDHEGTHSVVLHLQHIQTGATWQLSSLDELNEILDKALDKLAEAEDENKNSEVRSQNSDS